MVATLMSDILSVSNSTDTSDDNTFWSRLNEVKLIHGFIASFSVIIVSELGDKTFFIAAIMAMRHSRLKVFAAAMLAILVMNTLAVLMGMATTVIPPVVIKYASSGLFLIFSIKMFYEGCNMTEEDSKEEMEEVQKAISKKELSASDYSAIAHQDPETGIIIPPKKISIVTKIRRKLMQYLSLVFIETFTMTFLAEWGDRSQISTIILAASDDVYGVFFGALSGHFICTGIAVLGGRIISQMISVKTVTILGAFIFLLFAILGIFLK